MRPRDSNARRARPTESARPLPSGPRRRLGHLRARSVRARGDLLVHLSCLLFIRQLAEESRTNAYENKCSIINKDHVVDAAKVILKKCRG
uniref:centromere protein W-like n=1 Tax=Jaculus jaculus TaxID=51337 RepID=UPI001E1B6058|nr:centromere protein W-like [Jaculus jaculus]